MKNTFSLTSERKDVSESYIVDDDEENRQVDLFDKEIRLLLFFRVR